MDKLEPWQADLLVNLSKGQQTLNMSRQMGKSTWTNMLRNFMNKPTSRFVPYELHYKYGLMIQDYMWWTANERAIHNWMAEHLPEGIDHQAGMTVTFDTDQQRMLFLLRWA